MLTLHDKKELGLQIEFKYSGLSRPNVVPWILESGRQSRKYRLERDDNGERGKSDGSMRSAP